MEDDFDRTRLTTYVHDIINKSISAQGYLKVLQKTNLNPEQLELIKNASSSLKASIEHIKALRSEIRD